MPEDQQPPERIWLNDKALEAHFKMVRDAQRPGSSESIQIPDMDQNEITKELTRR